MQASGILGAKPLISAHRVRVRSIHTPGIDTSMAATSSTPTPKWAQKTITLSPQRRGCHLITSKVSAFSTYLSIVYGEELMSHVIEVKCMNNPGMGSSAPWKHTIEGPDDMPAHIKSSMFGCALTIPITNGKLNMGTWQGIWLCEHRDYPTARKVVITLNGI
ncbi:hypothetical protein Cgig2_008141 [Carnegiea gigantea]|uniref:Secondary thiamine-phosphate synthase enzyme n=1 Tax=Carnegiea gigantea TaxID=171969 RepID=A0A9Q1L371_9CARY|nr:hypothetical protein Cgig2_008141 [Carnegiea gigantea]